MGIGGSNLNRDKDKLRIVTTDKEMTVCKSREEGGFRKK